MHIYTFGKPHTIHTLTRTTDYILPGPHFLALFNSQIFAFCVVLPLYSGLLSGRRSERSAEVEQSGNSLLIPAELAFRFTAGLLPNRHHRSRPANQRGTQALMRADA